MTQLKPFNETMTEIASVFGFEDIQSINFKKIYYIGLTLLDPQCDIEVKDRAMAVLHEPPYSDELTIMLEFAKLYIKLQQFVENDKDFGFLVESGETPRVYTSLDKLVEYLAKYRVVVTDTETFLYRFGAIKPIELI